MVYLFLANGFEDMEAVVPFDLMKRAGIDVATVGVGGKNIKSAHGLSVTAEISENEVDFEKAEAFVFPGGWPGAKNLKNSETVNNAITFALQMISSSVQSALRPDTFFPEQALFPAKNIPASRVLKFPKANTPPKKLKLTESLLPQTVPLPQRILRLLLFRQ